MTQTLTHQRLVRLMVVYGIALTVIAVTILSSSLLMRYSITRATGDSRVINLSGRQRMLSQRLTKCVLAMERGQADRLGEIRQALQEFTDTHEGLLHGSNSLGLPARDYSPEAQRLFNQVEAPYRSMIEALTALDRSGPHIGDPLLVDTASVLLAQEPSFLDLMDRITFQLDAESKDRIQGLKTLEWVILAVGLIVLSLEFLLVFRPSLLQLSVMVDALEQRGEELAAANHAYMELLPFVSHELKNPIASMMTDARVMSEGYLGTLDTRQVQKLEKLIAKGDYLLGLVREYMDLARIEGGDLQLKAADVAFVEEVLEPSVDIIQAQAQEKGMHLERDYAEYPDPVACDPNLMKIVVVNLLGNAVKYGKEGGRILLRFQREASVVKVAIRNEGPGFSAGDRSLLFKKFSRLPSPELRSKKGTGVGLYTCSRIVSLHGGSIEATSELGSWAEFEFHFPQPLRSEGGPESVGP
jgi:signal transduction histidine kinase